MRSWVRAAEDNSIGVVKLIEVRRCLFGSSDVGLDARNGCRSAVDGLGLKLCVAVATMVNGVNSCHKSKSFASRLLSVGFWLIQLVSDFSVQMRPYTLPNCRLVPDPLFSPA